ncbi:hypothetical protein FZI91_16695 [Mycobacterium sp. CBMA271]|uniref:hypothetical protein n=1 Tax=unclassified Mycobacteroides TaxID=2618759 RepID=UPI0012DEA7E1|nr:MULTISPECIES: hypothetical protein [unclassified Mycobacteroides]MUM17091.1 hypothetical protein [Mycobacteroides sp. CBMA 326]MUM23329.1 hypothetical protein [Mycobacteroides sp. CBMA 271]
MRYASYLFMETNRDDTDKPKDRWLPGLLEDVLRYALFNGTLLYSFFVVAMCLGSAYAAMKAAGMVLAVAAVLLVVWMLCGRSAARQWVLIGILFTANTALVVAQWQTGGF